MTIPPFQLETYRTYAQQQFPALCQPRAIDSHKGSFGSVAIIGGASGMVGAPILAARAALKLGTGRTYIGFAQNQAPLAIDPLQAEIMLKTAQEVLALKHLSALVIGCGLGLTTEAEQLLQQCLEQQAHLPLVIDADALTLLAQHKNKLQALQNSPTQAAPYASAVRILTPHPSEAARLLHCETSDIQADRAGAAREIVERYQAWVVLKGHQTLIASPSGLLISNQTGNPGLASGGTGDVLAGMIGALLAQSIPIEQAVSGAVWLHGAAADYLVSQGIGPIGMCATEVIEAARTLRNQLIFTGA